MRRAASHRAWKVVLSAGMLCAGVGCLCVFYLAKRCLKYSPQETSSADSKSPLESAECPPTCTALEPAPQEESPSSVAVFKRKTRRERQPERLGSLYADSKIRNIQMLEYMRSKKCNTQSVELFLVEIVLSDIPQVSNNPNTEIENCFAERRGYLIFKRSESGIQVRLITIQDIQMMCKMMQELYSGKRAQEPRSNVPGVRALELCSNVPGVRALELYSDVPGVRALELYSGVPGVKVQELCSNGPGVRALESELELELESGPGMRIVDITDIIEVGLPYMKALCANINAQADISILDVLTNLNTTLNTTLNTPE